MKRCFPLLTFLATLAILGAPQAAWADFKLMLSEPGSLYADKIIGDNLAGDSNATLGSIRYAGTYGHFYITYAAGTSNRTQPGDVARLTLGSMSVRNTDSVNPHTLILSLTDTGFTFPNLGFGPLVIDTTASSTMTSSYGPSTITFQNFGDAANSPFGTSFAGDAVVMSYLASPTSSSQSGSASNNLFNPTGIYSLTSRLTFDLARSANTNSASGKGEEVIGLVPVPVPASLVMIFMGLPVLGLGYWLRRRGQPREVGLDAPQANLN